MKTDESPHSSIQRFVTMVEGQFHGLLRKRWTAIGILFLTTLLLGLFGSLLLEWLLFLPSEVKITLLTVAIIIAAAAAIYVYRQLSLPDFKSFYHRFSKQHDVPQLSDALDLYLADKDQQSRLQEAAINQNVEALNPGRVRRQLDDFIKTKRTSRYLRSVLFSLGGVLFMLILVSSWQPSAVNRLAHFWMSYTPPNPYSFTIEPGTVTLEQGESFTPAIDFQGNIPEDLMLAFKTDIEEEFRRRNATTIENNRASFSPITTTTSVRYYFVMDGFQSQEHTISVQLRPRLEQLTAQIIPPAYTRLDTSTYSYPFTQVQAYEGSTVQLKTTTNKPVEKFILHRTALEDTSVQQPQKTDALSFNYEWEVTQTDTVLFEMRDSAGLANKNHFRFTIDPRQDQSPFVNLLAPSEALQMKTPEAINLRYEAGDDFGLTSASLHYELQQAFQKDVTRGSISLGQPAMNQEHEFNWEVPALNPKPRDTITYWIEVADNDAYKGYKIGRSQKMSITFPSMAEYMDELDSRENEVTESLDDISDSFEQMEQEYEEFKENLKRNPETNWDQKQQLQEVENERQEIDKKVDELNNKFEEIRKEIEKNQAMSPETMKAYDELQQLMKEINDPELAKALEELQKSLGNMSPEQMRKALEDYEFNEELYKERIERTKELFKSLKLNSDLDKMARSLQELAKQEESISESEQSPSEDLEQQKAVQEDLQELKEKLEKLGEHSPDKAKEQIDKLGAESQEQMNQIEQELQENMERLQKQQEAPTSDPETREQQRDIQQQLQQMAQQMEGAKQQMNQQRNQVNAQALEYILYSLLNLSSNQEELTQETEPLPPRSQAFVDKARKEQNISQQFTSLSDSLFELSSEIPSFSNRINKKKVEVENQLSRAVNMLSERDKSNSTFAQRQSLGGINELSSMIASLLDQLQNQQGGGSGSGMSMQQMIEQMQKMSGHQQKLNEQIQNMINDIQGDRLSRDQMERLNQLSKQQNNIRKQIRKLQQSGELESGDQVLSELERMSEQMEDAINDLRGGQLDGELMQRQQNILSRMLNAEKAVQERGKKEEREGTTAEERQQSAPPEITLEELQQRIRKMLNDPDHTSFSGDYQRLIEQYFELLKKQEKQIIQ